MKNPNVRNKTYFITSKVCDKIFTNWVSQYGNIMPIEVEGFAQLCYTLPKPAPTNDPYTLKAFRFLDPLKDKKALAPPTPIEILNLVTYGTFNYHRCLSTLPHAEYVVPRQELVNDAANKLKDARCLLVHSRLGNGKSVFLYILAHRLSEEGYKCFWCQPNSSPLQNEIEILYNYKKVALFFDSYNTAIDLIEQFADLPPESKFIISVRTSIHDARLHEILRRLPDPLGRVNLNGITRQDTQDFKRLLDRSGIRPQDLERVIDNCKDFREVVVRLYDNSKIKDKIKRELFPLLENTEFRNVFIVSHLLKWSGQDVDAAFVRSVTGADAYVEIARFREVTGDIFKMDDDVVQVRSALFSEYLMKNLLKTAHIIESVYEIIIEAVKRKLERRYQAI